MPVAPSQALQRAVSIWLLKPHVANRRIFGSKTLDGAVESVSEIIDGESGHFKRLLIPRNPQFSTVEEDVDWLPDRKSWRFRAVCISEGHVAEYEVSDNGDDIDPVSVQVLFIKLSTGCDDWIFSDSWFSSDFVDRLNHWHSQSVSETNTPIVAPMNSIDVERYITIQRRLKERYGRNLISTWTEKTNAEKFVYEDIAIASYLISLWSASPSSVKFVDLGCGNGLLVYLLNGEGFAGVGIDVRRRKIWDKYPANIVNGRLLEVTLDPSDPSSAAKHLPDETTWLIGNHSDELTPWLPVLSARLSSKCNFFVLPCCPFDLFSKFSSPGHNSRYKTYIDFIGNLTEQCGFAKVEKDMMRIPSTRRTCWIGWATNSEENDARVAQLKAVDEVVEAGRKRAGDILFKPRPNIEPVQNCTQLPTDIRDDVCDLVFSTLLKRGEAKRQKLSSGTSWNAGGVLTVSEISSMLSSETLAAMKCQRGGLQTLLKNHHQAFDIHGGQVRIRKEVKMGKEEAKRNGRLKTSVCWMSEHHPDGCPRTAQDCPFKHAEDEIS